MRPRALLLLSGGFDSPVAGFLLQSAGFDLEAVHFSLVPFTDDSSEKKAERLARHLGLTRLHILQAGLPFSELAKASRRLYFVLSKRAMLRASGLLALDLGCSFLATGENLGQVSSQTLRNLSVIDRASPTVVLRPLLAYDKIEILREAEKLGTYEISKGPEVCDLLGPDHPSTAARLFEVERVEGELPMDSLIQRILQSRRVVEWEGKAPA